MGKSPVAITAVDPRRYHRPPRCVATHIFILSLSPSCSLARARARTTGIRSCTKSDFRAWWMFIVHVDAAGCEIVVDTSEKSRALAQRFEKSTHTRANH
jgi:hypothetical protein